MQYVFPVIVTVLKYPSTLTIPECPEGDDADEWSRAFRDATVYLIGTAHFRYVSDLLCACFGFYIFVFQQGVSG